MLRDPAIGDAFSCQDCAVPHERDVQAFDERAATYESDWRGKLHLEIVVRTLDCARKMARNRCNVLISCWISHLGLFLGFVPYSVDIKSFSSIGFVSVPCPPESYAGLRNGKSPNLSSAASQRCFSEGVRHGSPQSRDHRPSWHSFTMFSISGIGIYMW